MYNHKQKVRDSKFELLRIIAMFFIISYHQLYFFIEKLSSNDIVYRSLELPLHIGVILFVLISGYYGIKFSKKGVLSLLMPVLIIYTPLQIIYNYASHEFNLTTFFSSFLILSNSPYWYVRTYLFLFVFSPILNTFIETNSLRNNLRMTFVLGFISIYFGIFGTDESLFLGKNIIHFSFLYFLGKIIRNYRDLLLKRIRTNILILLYIGLNFVICFLYIHPPLGFIRGAIIKLCFLYCSPILIINACLLFLIVDRVKIQNAAINKIASSTYEMYIFHHCPIILYGFIGTVLTYYYQNYSTNYLSVMIFVFLVSLLIMLCTWVFTMITKPISNKLSDKIIDLITKPTR